MKLAAIVGCGSLGSHCALLLRNEAALRLIDFDRVEAKNLMSQMHGKIGVGKNKALALDGLLRLTFDIRSIITTTKLTVDNADAVLKGADIVIDACDNADGRRACQVGARAVDVPCLHGGLAANGEYGMVRWDDDFIVSDASAGVPTCENGEHLPFNAQVAGWMAMAAQRYLRAGEKRGFAVTPTGVMVL